MDIGYIGKAEVFPILVIDHNPGYKSLGFKTTRTVVWCADHTALCGPHPHSRLKNLHTTTISPQFILTFFVNFWRKKIFQRDF